MRARGEHYDLIQSSNCKIALFCDNTNGFCALLIFWVYWIVVMAYLGSAGVRVYDKDGKFEGYKADNTLRYMGVSIRASYLLLYNSNITIMVLLLTL